MNTTHEIITKYIDDIAGKVSDQAADKAVKKYQAQWQEDMTVFKKEIRESQAVFKKEIREDFTIFKKDVVEQFENQTKALREGFQDDIKKAAEMTSSFTTRIQVREIVQEEIKTLEADVAIIKYEVGLINQKLATR